MKRDIMFMMKLINWYPPLLGKDYIVRDKAASIQFMCPGRGKVSAEFALAPELIDDLRTRADASGKVKPMLTADVLDTDGKTVAHVEKLLYIRKKNSESKVSG